MSAEPDIVRLLRWRQERAEAYAPTPPRAAYLLQLVEEFDTSAIASSSIENEYRLDAELPAELPRRLRIAHRDTD